MDLLAALRASVGERHVLVDRQLATSYEVDWTGRFRGRALAVVRPANGAEVGAVIAACAAHGVPLVPQGGNTGLVGGGVPDPEAVVLSLARIRDLEPVDAVAGQVTVGAGTTLAALQAHARSAGWEFGVDLAARDSATLGGMAATNAGGTHVLRHGDMRQQVIGVEAVLADGSVVSRLSGLVKDNTGYDLAGLLVGSEGTLGIIIRLRLRLVPRLPRRAVALLGLPSARAAVDITGELRRRLPTLLAAELFTADGLGLVVRHARLAPPFASRHPAYLLFEVADAATDPAPELAAAVEAVAPNVDALLETEAAARDRLWAYRERHTEAIAAEGVPHKLDIALPISAIADFMEQVVTAVEGATPGARVVLFGHVGDGNVHVNVLGPPAEDDAVDEAVLRLAVSLGGSISAEHGIGRAKARWLALDRSAGDLAAMRAIKHTLDPAGILNPGALFER